MLELTGVASVLRGLSILYWLVAAAALIAVLWRIKSWRGKAIGSFVVIAVFGFMPIKGYVDAQKRQDYAREAWAYFKRLCDEKSGQKIYKTFTGVKSVLVVKPLPPATEKDLYNQYWYGDPYSNATPVTDRGESVASRLIYDRKLPTPPGGTRPGFSFVEIKHESKTGTRYRRISRVSEYPHQTAEDVREPVSRFGVTWDDISTPESRKYWVAGSHLRIFDLADNSLVAERIGFFIEAGFGSEAGARRPWLASRGPSTTCPYAHDYVDQWFILSALSPTEEK